MKAEAFLAVLGDIDDALILESAAPLRPVRIPLYRTLGAVAACLTLAVGAIVLRPYLFPTNDQAEYAPDAHWQYSADGKTENELCDTAYPTETFPETTAAATAATPFDREQVNAFLAQSGSSVRCTAVTMREGVWYITLAEEIPEELRAALIAHLTDGRGIRVDVIYE